LKTWKVKFPETKIPENRAEGAKKMRFGVINTDFTRGNRAEGAKKM